ncbi:hypothetical protein [Mycobacteroides abscessus]|uniref:hypothetical protein n=1 Tax=Mycobacteroides abscessus TaxID=36809 RepID=UPI0011C48A6D|nr:hypothetical protein [Mycobacteroides abscessus]
MTNNQNESCATSVVSLVAEVQQCIGESFSVRAVGGSRKIEITSEPELPWSLRLEGTPEGWFPYFTCRTSSSQFGGDRTDLNDFLSILLAVALRGRAWSAGLVDVEHPAVPEMGELYARHVVLVQPSPFLTRESVAAEVREILKPMITLGFLLPQALGIYDCLSKSTYGFESLESTEWVSVVRKALRLKGADADVVTSRENPDWRYFRSARSGISVLSSSISAEFMLALTATGHPFETDRRLDRCFDGPTAELLERGAARNAIPRRISARLASLFRAIELCEPHCMIALENAVVGVGDQHVVLMPAISGAAGYEAGRRAVARRHAEDAGFLNGGLDFQWADPTNPGRFENLILELLRVEPGVRVRASGNVNDRDQGRDLHIEKYVRHEVVAGTEASPVRRVRVVGQCKVRRGAVSKVDVPDILDTLTRHNAVGFFLAVSTYVTSDLANWLDGERAKSPEAYEWWTRVEIEDRLRRNPGIAARFSDVVWPVGNCGAVVK